MKLTKFEHSGIAIEKDGKVLLFDPVVFEEEIPDFSGVVGIVITHKHEDHCQPAIITRCLVRNPDAKIFTTEDNVKDLKENITAILSTIGPSQESSDEAEVSAGSSLDPDLIKRLTENVDSIVSAARPGDTIKIGNFDLRFFGGGHAAIIPGQTPCQNLGVEVDDKIVNPGDSFDVSGIETAGKVLLAPIAAPWCKISEVADFVRNAKPSIVVPIHDAVLSHLGFTYSAAHIASVCDEIGAEFHALSPGESIEV